MMTRNHRKLLSLVGLGLLVAGSTACKDERPTDVEDVVYSTDRYIGKTVTLSGEVDTVFNDRAFELEGHGLLWDEEILVLTQAPVILAGAKLEDDDDVVVEGVVRELKVRELEAEVGWDFDAEIDTETYKLPAIVAYEIRVFDERALWKFEPEELATGQK